MSVGGSSRHHLAVLDCGRQVFGPQPVRQHRISARARGSKLWAGGQNSVRAPSTALPAAQVCKGRGGFTHCSLGGFGGCVLGKPGSSPATLVTSEDPSGDPGVPVASAKPALGVNI